MSDEKEKELKKRMVLCERVSMEIDDIKKQLETSREEWDREKRSKELEENRLKEIIRLEQKLAELIENLLL